MGTVAIRTLVLVGTIFLAYPLRAQEKSERALPVEDAPRLEEVALQPLLDTVARQTKRQFLIEPRVRPYVTVRGGIKSEDVTYPILLSILRLNHYAAITVQGIVNIVPDVEARYLRTPIIRKADPAIADDEWVTRIVPLKYIDGKQAIAVLRPLMPQEGHMVWLLEDNSLLLVDRYANTERLAELLQVMDKPPSATRKSGSNGAESSN